MNRFSVPQTGAMSTAVVCKDSGIPGSQSCWMAELYLGFTHAVLPLAPPFLLPVVLGGFHNLYNYQECIPLAGRIKAAMSDN